MTRRVDTLVVGAGVSGLAFARARGGDLLVLEASERVGGFLRTESAEGFRFELGPEALRLEPGGELTRLLKQLDIELVQPAPSARKRFIVHRGRLVEAPLSPPKLATTPLLGLRAKLRLLTEPWRDSKRGLDGSIADFVRHRIGREALEALVDPLVSGIHAGDPEQLSMRACFPRLVEQVERHGSLLRALRAHRGAAAATTAKPRGGCQALADALAQSLGNKLILRAPVTSLAFDGALWTARAAGEIFTAPQLVLAVSAATAARLLSSVAPALARALGSIAAESLVSIVHAWPRVAVTHPLDGFGYLVPARERREHLGTLFSSSIEADCAPRDHVLLRTLAGGSRAPTLVDESDARLLELVTRDVAPLLGLRGDPAFTRVHRWRAALPRFDLEHVERVGAIERSLPPGLSLLGNYLHGIGVNHLVERASARASAAS